MKRGTDRKEQRGEKIWINRKKNRGERHTHQKKGIVGQEFRYKLMSGREPKIGIFTN